MRNHTATGSGHHPKAVVVATSETYRAATELELGLITGGNPAVDFTEDDEPYRDNIVAGLYANGLLVSH